MSEFSVPVVSIQAIEKHDNADSLSLTEVDGCPVIFRTGDFQAGDLAVYLPVEAVVPTDHKAFSFLATKVGQTKHRIKAKKLRGTFSMGLLVKLQDAFPAGDLPKEGDDVAERLGVIKYVEPVHNLSTGGMRRRAADTRFCPVYDIESHRKYKSVYLPGETVVLTEKVHGCNGRFLVHDLGDGAGPQLMVGSHNYFNLETPGNVWWIIARQMDFATKLADPVMAGKVLYGEVYGQVQDLKYGTSQAEPLRFAAFDIYDVASGKFVDYQDFRGICEEVKVPTVPVLYIGPFDQERIEAESRGKTTICDGQIREGVVIKPAVERFDRKLGRVITKLVGEQYLLRKSGTEFQ